MLVDENECICVLLIKFLAQMYAYFLVMNSKQCNTKGAFSKNTQFQTTMHKPYPISDQNGQNLYPFLRPKQLEKPYSLEPIVLII